MRLVIKLPALPAIGFLALLSSAALEALEIRNYLPERHDRFTGFPTAPAWNPTNWVSSIDYSGIGWSVSDPRRQFALISPQHVLLSAQWPIAAGEQIRFLGRTGQWVTRTIESTTQILDNGVGTDLMVGRLSEPDLDRLLTPLRHTGGSYYYADQPMLLHIFGASGTVGGAKWWPTFTAADGSGSTRSYVFDYSAAGDGPDDCYFTAEDIGSPTCWVFEGRAALKGIHSASEVDDTGAVYSNVDSLVSAYVPQIDAIMAKDGWRMTPVGTPQVNSGMGAAVETPLVRTQPGEMIFTMLNSSTYENGNIRATVRFNPGTAPDSVTADGWMVDEAGPLEWKFHRATLPASSSVTLKATWAAVPDVSVLWVVTSAWSDLGIGMSVAYPFFTEAPPVVTEPEEPEEPVLERGNAIHYTPEHASDRAHGWWNPNRSPRD